VFRQARPAPAGRGDTRIVVDNQHADADRSVRMHLPVAVNGNATDTDAGWETF
jgi:hypothetical protein